MSKSEVGVIPETEFDSKFGLAYASVFVDESQLASLDRSVRTTPFVNKAWETVLVPYGLYGIITNATEFKALERAALEVGDEVAIITDIEPIPPHRYSVLTTWDEQSFEAACDTGFLKHVDSVLFGRSMGWGAFCATDDYSWIGGHAGFMQVFIAEAGGITVLRDRFLSFASDEWQVDSAFRDALLERVGWLAR
ncbi:hypothetical protein [Gloeobacter violaceus]|uniref:hypothetical protein n=1 Tax=Gloeobacter violaceus TaxID=33072 RepID=UPI0013E8C9CE|nr:hypothetical protein [Gloeobacter violaceus]